MREKPHRLPRDCYRGIVTVSFTACIDRRKTPFLDKAIVDPFLDFLRDGLTKNQCLALIYCFMPDHFHVILQGEASSADTWRAMVDFKQKSGFWFGRNRPDYAWQKDFHDHVIRANEDLAAHVRYVADNPVRWGLVKTPLDYRFTGAIGSDLKEIFADVATL